MNARTKALSDALRGATEEELRSALMYVTGAYHATLQMNGKEDRVTLKDNVLTVYLPTLINGEEATTVLARRKSDQMEPGSEAESRTLFATPKRPAAHEFCRKCGRQYGLHVEKCR